MKGVGKESGSSVQAARYRGSPNPDMKREKEDEPVEMAIDGVLDLHTFQPREVKALLPDYVSACLEKGITEIRIIHGKGTGNLRRTVHGILERMEEVASYHAADESAGSWGATIVILAGKPFAR